MSSGQIAEAMVGSINNFFELLGTETPSNLHDQFMGAAEKPLLEEVMRRTRGNQVKASQMLGINRNTLRKKLMYHGLL
jgi:Fis family transcriptional regulator